MQTVNEIIDSYSGMITRGQATALVDGSPDMILNVSGLLDFIKLSRNKKDRKDTYTVSVEDKVYRVFNEVRYKSGLGESCRRTVTLGSEGTTINITLSGALSDQIDTSAIERGDKVMIKDASLVTVREELNGDKLTTIPKVGRSSSGIIDYSRITSDLKNIDIVGKVTEIGTLQYVNQLGRTGQVPVASCRITDMKNTADVALWGSCALLAARINVNDFIKIEFCSAYLSNSIVRIQASDLSRVLINKEISKRLNAHRI